MVNPEITAAEKVRCLEQWQYRCYICTGDFIDERDAVFAGFEDSTGEHVPVHAYCYQKKGSKSLAAARDEARIDRKFTSSPAALFPGGKELPRISINPEKTLVSFDGERLPLYRCPNTGGYYFYHQIGVEYLTHDPLAGAPELNRDRVVALAAHLHQNPQLLPAVCRLAEGRLWLVDGAHRTAAQALGNGNEKVDCKVYCDLPAGAAASLVAAGHSAALRQGGYKPGRLSRRLREVYSEPIRHWQERNPDRACSEWALFGEELRMERDRAGRAMLREITALVLADGEAEAWFGDSKSRQNPFSALILRLLVQNMVESGPLTLPLEAEDNYREEELDNFVYLLRCLVHQTQGSIASPSMGAKESGRKSGEWYRERLARIWIRVLATALREKLRRPLGLCYGRRFGAAEADAAAGVIYRLLAHFHWLEGQLPEILKIKDPAQAERLLRDCGLTSGALIG